MVVGVWTIYASGFVGVAGKLEDREGSLHFNLTIAIVRVARQTGATRG